LENGLTHMNGVNERFGACCTARDLALRACMAVVFLCAVGLLSACETKKLAVVEMPVEGTRQRVDLSDLPIRDSYGTGDHIQKTGGLIDMARIISTEDVQVFPLDGATPDPMAGNERRRTVFENTTSGGYTVLNQDVLVFPLEDGERPSYLPDFIWPKQNFSQRTPFEANDMSQSANGAPQAMSGYPTNPMTDGPLPGKSFDRPATGLPPIADQPRLSLPAPTAYKDQSPSPFNDAGNIKAHLTPPDSGPHLTAPQAPVAYSGMTTTPVLAGPSLSAVGTSVPDYVNLSDRAGAKSSDMPMKPAEPVALYRRQGASISAPQPQTLHAQPVVPPYPTSPAPVAAPMTQGGTQGETTSTTSPRKGMLTGY